MKDALSSRMIHLTVVVVTLSLIVVACGQKPGVHAGGFGVGTDGGGVGTGTGGAATGTVGGTGGTAGVGGTGAGTTGGTAGVGGTGAGTTGGTGGFVGGDTTGVTRTTITIGVHAPITGAAPIEPKAFAAGKDLYWRWLHEVKKKTVHGREVKVVFRNDEYTPTTAVAVCSEMASRERAFLLIGAAGTDQINACAGYADPRKIPYLSPGVQEAGLQFRRTYFPVTMSYKQQMPLLIQMLEDRIKRGDNLNRYGGAGSKIKVGHVRPNTPNFNDAADALKQAALGAGFEYKTYTVVKEGRADEAKTVAAQMEQDNVDVVVPITAPVFTIGLSLGGDSNGYRPLYAGVGITNNINQMIAQACRRYAADGSAGFHGALFFSPWPGWRETMISDTTLDPDFKKAANKYAPSLNKRDKGGDILLALWGIMKTLHRMLEAAGPNLSREGFVFTLNGGFQSSLKIFPDIQYSATNHFGARNVHVLKGDCDAQGDGEDVSRGPQYVSHPDYKGLRSSF